jgi:hypothetical protein
VLAAAYDLKVFFTVVAVVSAVQIACSTARWSASASAWWRVWVAESCWPS